MANQQQRTDFIRQLYDIFVVLFTTKMPSNVGTTQLPTIQAGMVYAVQCIGHMLFKSNLSLDVIKFKEIVLMYDDIDQEFVVNIPMINNVNLEFAIVLLKDGETVNDQVEFIADDFIRNGIRGICTKFSLETDTFIVDQDINAPNDVLDSRILFALDVYGKSFN